MTKNVSFANHDGGLWVIRNLYPEYSDVDLISPIVVGDNVHIGIGAAILPGVTIVNNCIIGYGAIVTKDIPDNSIAVGVPARVIENVDDYLKKHHNEYIRTKNLPSEEKKQFVLKVLNQQNENLDNEQ